MHRIIFENVGVFDGVQPRINSPRWVQVYGNEIVLVSDQPIVAAEGDKCIDCAGKVLMPGLIDCHVHVYANSLNFTPPGPPATYRAQYAHKFLDYMLGCGFTTVRDVAGGDHGLAMALRDKYLVGPRFFYGGLCLTQTGGHGDMRPMSQGTNYLSCAMEHNILAVRADGVDECVRFTREELRKGASHIKIMASGGVVSPTDPLNRCQYSEAEIRAIVDECDRYGAYVCAHCHPVQAIRRCVEFGVRCIEHGTLIDERTANYVVEKGAYVVPTMAVMFALLEDGARIGMSEVSREKLLKVRDYALKGIEIMKRAGVKMGFGTDLIGEHHIRQTTEFGIRSEVLSPFDILHSATAVNAEILQQKGRLGIVKAGALADLVLVNGNPLENIRLLEDGGEHLCRVMVDGRFVRRERNVWNNSGN